MKEVWGTAELQDARINILLVRVSVSMLLAIGALTSSGGPATARALLLGVAVLYGVYAVAGFLIASKIGIRRRRLYAAWEMLVDFTAVLAAVVICSFAPNNPVNALICLVPILAAIRYSWSVAGAWMLITGLSFLLVHSQAVQLWGLRVEMPDQLMVVVTGLVLTTAIGLTTIQHVRERSRLEERHARDEDRMARMKERDELRNTFLAAVSHELRTPLTSILGFAITLQDHATELTPAHRSFLDQIARASTDLDRMLRDLLDLERLTRGTSVLSAAPTDVSNIVGSVVDRIAHREHRAITITGHAGIVACVDEFQIERIVENLVSNAVKYSPPGSPITAGVYEDAVDRGLEIIVEDGGPGVPAEAREAIFQPFERGEAGRTRIPGVGIGLSLVARFAQMHGGRAWVEDSATGVGSSFHVWLPINLPEQQVPVQHQPEMLHPRQLRARPTADVEVLEEVCATSSVG
jgi:signal transduction histidine kinase